MKETTKSPPSSKMMKGKKEKNFCYFLFLFAKGFDLILRFVLFVFGIFVF